MWILSFGLQLWFYQICTLGYVYPASGDFLFYEIKYKIILMLVYDYNKDLIENYPVILY